MLLELQAANAAFAIIKKTIENGSEIAKAGKAIADFTNAKDAVDAQCRKHGNNPNSDLEAFLAKEEIDRRTEEIREAMQLYGRGGMYNDYVKFCVEARKARAAAVQQAKEDREQMLVYAMYLAITLGIAGFVIGVAYLSINK